ncbi:hypothetical protein [Streptomyces caeruleatus]|uniref:hypothetical protein n=1 Tax=Streptomyces caeruleatus TaxID=661399 RepID=UPI00131E7029|nr:hypothetical protein [Streptomyces caeruleatus]
MDEDPNVRRAAFDLYVALHCLADSQSLGLVITSARDKIPGDIHDALTQLDRCRDMLSPGHPDLVHMAQEVVFTWEEHRTDRLAQLMTLLDELAAIAGSSLPLQLPPTS